MSLQFALDASAGTWAPIQASGDRAALRAAVDRSIDLARIADEAGIESIWVMEDPDGWDAFAVLGAMARVTSRIRLGTGVTNPYFRHPALLAASTSTLDLLSNGRSFLGLGRGQEEWYREAMGIPVGKPVRALTETFDLLHQWWGDDMRATSSADATEYTVRDWERVIRPIDGAVPIYLAAVGPLALKMAGRLAEGVILNDLASHDFLTEAVSTVKASAVEAGRDPDSLSFYARAAITITDDEEQLYERRKSTVAMIHALPGMERLLLSDRFDTERIIADVRQIMNTDTILGRGGGFGDLRRGGDLAAARKAIPTDLMAELVVGGSVEAVRSQLREYERIGITHVFLAGQGPETTVESLCDLVQQLSVQSSPILETNAAM